MKGKKFHFILAAVLLVGLSSIYFFRKQKEAQFLEFEAYEIEHVERQVHALFNEERTDIVEEISDDELDKIDALIEELYEREYSPQNTQRLEKVEADFMAAKEMSNLQGMIRKLFVEEGIVEREVSIKEVEVLETEVERFQVRTVFYDRNQSALTNAKIQVRNIQLATDFIESLFEGEFVRETVTREDEEEALALIAEVKNEEVKESLLAQAELLNIALTETEEALALEEALAEQEAELELEESETENQVSSPTDTNWNRNNSESTWTPPVSNSRPNNTWGPQQNSGGQTNSESSPATPSTPPDEGQQSDSNDNQSEGNPDPSSGEDVEDEMGGTEEIPQFQKMNPINREKN